MPVASPRMPSRCSVGATASRTYYNRRPISGKGKKCAHAVMRAAEWYRDPARFCIQGEPLLSFSLEAFPVQCTPQLPANHVLSVILAGVCLFCYCTPFAILPLNDMCPAVASQLRGGSAFTLLSIAHSHGLHVIVSRRSVFTPSHPSWLGSPTSLLTGTRSRRAYTRKTRSESFCHPPAPS